MEIITRQEAISKGLKKYFTNEPCKNGHIAARYVRSSVCQDCLRVTSPRADDPNRAEILALQNRKLDLREKELEERKAQRKIAASNSDERVTRRQILSSMVKISVILPVSKIDDFYRVAWAHAVLRNPLVRLEDVKTSYLTRNSIWIIRCFPADADALMAFSKTLKAESLNISPPKIFVDDPDTSDTPAGDPK